MQPLGKPLVLALFACNSKTGYMISISRYIFLENFGKKNPHLRFTATIIFGNLNEK